VSQEREFKRNLGDLRPSQVLHTYGVGAIVELPHLSVMVMGLDDWDLRYSRPIDEDRLLKAVQDELGGQVTRLLTPPWTPESANFNADPLGEWASVGMPVAPFPRWMVCPVCHLLARIPDPRFQLSPSRPYYKDQNCYVHSNCPKSGKPPTVVPARFLLACENGHLDDFPWREFVHKGPTSCREGLRLFEMGTSGEVADIYVRCDCDPKTQRSLVEAFGEDGHASLGPCRGRHPHLRVFDEPTAEGKTVCDKDPRPVLLGASNSWFPMRLSVLSIPPERDDLGSLVDDRWAVLKDVTTIEVLRFLRGRHELEEFSGYELDDVWAAIERKRSGAVVAAPAPTDLKWPEWEVLSQPGCGRESADLRLREVAVPSGYERWIERVVLAERLREVGALVGFTRIDPPGDPSDPDQVSHEQRVRLSNKAPTWVPAAETRGEGIFLQLKEDELQGWLVRPEVEALSEEFRRAHGKWRSSRGLVPDECWPGIRYVLLHSLAHAILRQLSLDCGYAAASLRERVYSQSGASEVPSMAGVLIYTATPDSDGTLGGLVSLGRQEFLGYHLDRALDAATLCASDPLCAEHRAHRGVLSLHAAACHACLFVSETSCERGNKYLDRSVLVPTVDRRKLGFFRGPDG